MYCNDMLKILAFVFQIHGWHLKRRLECYLLKQGMLSCYLLKLCEFWYYIYIGVKQSLVFKLWVLESEKKSMLFWGLRSSNLFGDSHFLCTAICQCKILLLYFLYTSYQSFSLCSTNSHKFSFFFFFLLLLFSYMWIQKMTWASSDCSLILDF